MANLKLLRRDSYLHQLRYSVKPNTVLALRTAPVHLDTLFPESLVIRAEKEVGDYDGRRQTNVSSVCQLPCVPCFPNIPCTAGNPPVGGRLYDFWSVCAQRGAGQRVVQILKEISFQTQAPTSQMSNHS